MAACFLMNIMKRRCRSGWHQAELNIKRIVFIVKAAAGVHAQIGAEGLLDYRLPGAVFSYISSGVGPSSCP